jgi:hypothetical protein
LNTPQNFFAAKARAWIIDGSSEDGEWRGNYFIRRTRMTVEQRIAKHVTSLKRILKARREHLL